MFSSHLMLSVPFHTNATLISQNPRNASQLGSVSPTNVAPPPSASHPGHRIPIIAEIASPPMYVWIPNHPHATSARARLGTCAPNTPNDARANTGNGTP